MTGAALAASDPALAPAAAGLACGCAAAAVLAPARRVEGLAAYAGGCVAGVLCVQPLAGGVQLSAQCRGGGRALRPAACGLADACPQRGRPARRRAAAPLCRRDPAGSGGRKPLLAGGDGERGVRRFSTPVRGVPLGHRQHPRRPSAPTADGGKSAGSRSTPPRWKEWRPCAPFWKKKAIWKRHFCPVSWRGASTRRRSARRGTRRLHSTAAAGRPASTPRPCGRPSRSSTAPWPMHWASSANSWAVPEARNPTSLAGCRRCSLSWGRRRWNVL